MVLVCPVLLKESGLWILVIECPSWTKSGAAQSSSQAFLLRLALLWDPTQSDKSLYEFQGWLVIIPQQDQAVFQQQQGIL